MISMFQLKRRVCPGLQGEMLLLGSGFVLFCEEWVFVTPADAAGGEEEPVHEDARAVVVGVVGEQPVPLVFLLTAAVAGTASSRALRADLLVDGLFKLLVVEDCPYFPVAVAGPVGCHYLYLALAHVLLVAFVLVRSPREISLSL